MITLVLAFHNHQPVGNFGWVFEDAYQRAYRPLMEEMQRWPSISFAQHYTGILLDWFAEHHPDFIGILHEMVHADRVELLSGGYYEPILAMLPERDRHEQIIRLNLRLRDEFGVDPEGMWLAERVWEPSLPSTLADAGLRYTFLDDTHFKHAGLDESELTGYFLTEDQGRKLAVFPIDKRLRYTMPFETPEATFEYLHSLNRKGTDRLVAFADDGEKFGIWPDTHTTVYEKKWLHRFCELLVANAGWVRTLRPRAALEELPPAGRVYLPTASYAEMLHWALPTTRAYQQYGKLEERLKDEGMYETYHSFVRGGFWRNFLVKYPEANAMQKKMHRASERLLALRNKPQPDVPPGAGTDRTPELLEDAARHLLAGQCNCPYWHGVFGGLYLANIRSAIYGELIASEVAMDRAEGLALPRVEVVDYDLDGSDEIIVETPSQAVYISPARGGCIFELDHKATRHNFIDLIRRRREGYHDLLVEHSAHEAHEHASTEKGARSIHESFKVKEEGLEKLLAYDGYRHSALVDHFLPRDVTASGIRAGTVLERGDFATGAYQFAIERSGDGPIVTLRRDGTVDGERAIHIEKRVAVAADAATLRADYVVASRDGRPIDGPFAVEMSYSPSAGHEPDRYYLIDGARPPEDGGVLASVGEAIGSTVELVDEWLGVRVVVESGLPARVLRLPVETISLSEDGFERNYQGSLVMLVWDTGGAVDWRISITQRILPLV